MLIITAYRWDRIRSAKPKDLTGKGGVITSGMPHAGDGPERQSLMALLHHKKVLHSGGWTRG